MSFFSPFLSAFFVKLEKFQIILILEFPIYRYIVAKEKKKKKKETKETWEDFRERVRERRRKSGARFHELTRPDENGGVRSNVTVPRDRGSPSVDLVKSDR